MNNKKKSLQVNPNLDTSTCDELSALIEIRPDLTDDRTSALDPSKLRRARREAEKVHRQIQKSQKFNRWTSKVVKIVLILVPLSFIVYTHYFDKSGLLSDIWVQAKKRILQFYSPLPKFTDLAPEGYTQLSEASAANLKTDGVVIQIALSTESPIFYIATNLPDNTVLDFYLTSKPSQILSDQRFKIKSTLTITKNFSKTQKWVQKDDSPLPAGHYEATITEGDEQPVEISNLLSTLPESLQAPHSTQGKKKIVFSKSFIINFGSTSDVKDFDSKLQSFQKTLKNNGINELKKAQQSAATLTSLFSTTLSANQHYLASKNKYSARDQWIGLHKNWTIEDPIFLEKGHFFTVVFDLILRIQGDIKSFKYFCQGQIQNLVEKSAFQDQMQKKSEIIHQELTDLQVKIDVISRQMADPKYTPALNQIE